MDRFDSERSDPHDTTDLKTLDRAELDADSSVLSTSRSHETTDEVAAGKLRTLKDIPDRRNSLSFSYSDEEDDTDLSPTLTTEKLCSKNSVLPNSASAEGDIGEFAARIAEAKVKKDNMKFSFPEPEFLKEIPKYDRDYEDHELEDASDLIPLLLSTQKIKASAGPTWSIINAPNVAFGGYGPLFMPYRKDLMRGNVKIFFLTKEKQSL